MSDFDLVIKKAIAELGVARTLGPQHAHHALTQARYHINLALDDARRQSAGDLAANENPPRPYERPLYLHLTTKGESS